MKLNLKVVAIAALCLAGCDGPDNPRISVPSEPIPKYTGPSIDAPEPPILAAPEPHLPARTKYMPEAGDAPGKPGATAEKSGEMPK